MQRSRFYGWRMGVLFGSCASAFVLCCNIGLAIAGAVRNSGYDKDGIADLMEEGEDIIERWNAVLHIFVNALSTILLAGSNYTMQVLSSPTRSEIDKAHEKGEWLDIGILSPRNLKFISRKRAALCIILATSSIPLHLFYNASIFKIIGVNEYRIIPIDVWSNQYEQMHFNDSSRNFTVARYRNLSNSQWRKSYESQYVSRYGDLYLAIDQIAFDTPQNTGSFSMPYSLPGNFSAHVTASELSSQSQDWVPHAKIGPVVSNSTDPKLTAPASMRVVNGFTTETGSPSRIQISLHFMIVVITFNFLKLVIMLCVLFTDRSEYIVTLGDAAGSFLKRPDHTTEGNCLLKDKAILYCRSSPAFATLDMGDEDEKSPYPKDAWQPRLRRYDTSVGIDKGIPAILSALLLIVLVVFIPLSTSDYTNPWAWGNTSDNVLVLGSVEATSKGTLFNAWLANMPQFLLSFCYLNLNTLCTAMASAQEWNAFGMTRKGLRVTKPKGEQRSTYFLQLPYKWAVPLIVISGVLHWLLSQTFFLVRFDAFDRLGLRKDEASKSACGASFSSLGAFFAIGFCLVLGVGWVGHQTMLPTIPPANSCSSFISAVCHPPSEEADPHLGRVKWGMVNDSPIQGSSHCSLSSKAVRKPEIGTVYY
ncbi:hypothetical protein BKA66DRAFT_534379 [Pyrenochaeta sp. MPI-SDFR-AT-0127]|nr:hypothetical protein BKA66DRAFT_534379 [Pyrenochaeta sp. MPI-SDFR-AT-0127]